MASLFDKLELEAFRAGITPRSRESMKWFRQKAQQLRPSRSSLLKDNALTLSNRPRVGSMFMYFYDPKTKDTLPYYDSCLLYTSPSPRDGLLSRMPSSA